MIRYILSSILSILIISFSPAAKAACTSTPGYSCVPVSNSVVTQIGPNNSDSKYPRIGYDSVTGLYKVVHWDVNNELYVWAFNSNLVTNSFYNLTTGWQIPDRADISNDASTVVFENYQYTDTAEISTMLSSNPNLTTRITSDTLDDLNPGIYSLNGSTTLVWQHNYTDTENFSRWSIRYKRNNNAIQTIPLPTEESGLIECGSQEISGEYCGENANFTVPTVWKDLVVYGYVDRTQLLPQFTEYLWMSNIITGGSKLVRHMGIESGIYHPHIHDNRIAYQSGYTSKIFTRDVIDANTVPHITLSAETPITMPIGCTGSNDVRPPRVGGGSGRYIIFGFTDCDSSVVGLNNYLLGKTSVIFLSYRTSNGTQHLYKVADLPSGTFSQYAATAIATYDIYDNMIVFAAGNGNLIVLKIDTTSLPPFFTLQWP